MKIETYILKQMLEAQEELNNKFSADWKNNVKKEWLFTAIFTEVAEYLESSPEQWKWWKNGWLKNDKQNQYIEIVDVIHFALSYMMIHNSNEEILIENDQVGEGHLSLFNALDAFRRQPSLLQFYTLIQSMLDYDNLDGSELIRIYFEKLAINHKRVDNGYTEGTYQKIDADGNEDNRAISVG